MVAVGATHRRSNAIMSRDNCSTQANGGTDMAGKFELYKDAGGKYRFRLKAGNGEIIATGEAYESKASALNGIGSDRRNAADATLDDQTN